jgi:hypothetical protein
MFVRTNVTFEDFGITLPPCTMGGVNVTVEQIFSDNAGRNANTGTFFGDVKCVKRTVTLSWDRLREEQFALIDKCLNNTISAHRVTMCLSPNEGDKGYVTRTYYLAAGSYTYSVAFQQNGKLFYDGVTCQLIEH